MSEFETDISGSFSEQSLLTVNAESLDLHALRESSRAIRVDL